MFSDFIVNSHSSADLHKLNLILQSERKGGTRREGEKVGEMSFFKVRTEKG